ncbi:MAG: hypothetical protein JO301_17035 [Chitinophagaceae bacterium]|nr:hypothetical protein [Chitinophagaceae bacterium]
MLSIRYKNQTVDIKPGQRVELSRSNPMFLLDSFLGEYSTPFVITYSERNVRNFGPFFFDLAIKKKGKFEVEVYDENSFAFNATLVLETAKVDRRVTGKGNASGYLIIGLSTLLNKLKDAKANTLKLGGTRELAYTTSDPTDGSDGYVQHFQNTWENEEDYIVAPIRNDLWTGIEDDEASNGWMNILDGNANLMAGQAYVLLPRLKYVLETMFHENGWVLDTSAMEGTGWENIFMFSVKPLFTLDVTWTEELIGDRYENLPNGVFKASISFRLAEWISPEITCSQLLLEHCKKYGWVPLCNQDSNVCRLVPLRTAKTGRVRDWTKYAAAEVNADFSGDAKVVEFKNSMPSNDEFPSKPTFEGLTIAAPVEKKADLPSPLGNYDNQVIYSYRENQWFRIELDETTNQRVWAVYADNIYDEETKNANLTFETIVSTLPVYRTKYRTYAAVDYYGLFPYCKQSRNKEWSLRTLYYHGMVNEVKADGTAGIRQYPYLSSIRVLPDGTAEADWSNVLKHDDGTHDYGIIAYWLRPWLDLIGLNEEDDQRLNIPIHVLHEFRWDDIINIFNIAYLVKSFVEPRGYTGFIQAKLQKLTLDKFDAEGASAPEVFLKMVFENETFTPFIDASTPFLPGANYTDVTQGDWVVHVFADAAGTIPALPTVPLRVNTELRTKNDDNPDPVLVPGTYNMNTLGQLVAMGTVITIHDYSDAVLNIPPNPGSHFIRSYRLLPGTGYRVIP